MVRKLTVAGVVGVLLLAVLFVVACGSSTTTSTAATTATTAAPTGTTAAPTATTAGGTETTAATTGTTAAATPATGEPIKIGVIASLTGVAAAPTPSIINAVKLEVDAFNNSGGINGRPIELIIEDDKTDPATAVSVATKMITQDKVTAILGPLSTPPCLAVMPLAEKYGVPLLRWDTPTNDAPPVKPYWSFICSVGPQDATDGLEKVIADNGWKKIVAAADILPPNFQPLQMLEKDAAAKGFTINYLKDTWQLDATDLSPQINKIYAAYQADKPDVLIIMSAFLQTPTFQKGLRALGVTVPIQSGPVSGHPALFLQGNEAVEGLYLLGAGITAPSQLPADYPGKQVMVDFATAYKAKYNEDATLFAGAGYDSMQILIQGLKAGVDDKQKIRDAIEGLKNFGVSQGQVNFGPDDHAMHGGYNQWQVKNGVFTFVKALN